MCKVKISGDVGHMLVVCVIVVNQYTQQIILELIDGLVS